MSRISSFSANTSLINQMLRTQLSLFNLETQVATEKKSQNYAGIAINAQRLVNLENTKTQLERFINNNNNKSVELSIQETVVENVRETFRDFKKALTNYEASASKDEESVKNVQTAAFQALRDMEDMLNTDIAGQFIFSGSRTTSEPVDFGATSLAAFQAIYDGKRVTVPTTRDAHLEKFSFSSDALNLNGQFVDPSNFLQFAQDADGVVTTGGNSSITATSALFANVKVGASIAVSNSTSNNGTYTVASVTNSGRTIEIVTSMLTDETTTTSASVQYRNPTNINNDLTLTKSNFGDLTFNRAANTITAATANGFNGIPVGTKITVSDTTLNNGTFTVDSNDGTTITVKSNKLTDEGLAAGSNFYDFHTGSQVVFTANAGTNDDTIQIQQNAGAGAGAVPNVFKNLAAGDTVTFASTGSNNATYTINTISADGSTITVNETVTTETDTNGATASGSNGFSYTAGTQLVFNAAGDYIEVQDAGGTPVNGAFSRLQSGMNLTVSGATTNNGIFTVNAVQNSGSRITVTQNIVTNETDTDGTRIQSFAASGTIAATPYYNGDANTTTHRTSVSRSFEDDLTAIDPAFEKAIRAMKLILQGVYGTDGGLDENSARVGQAQYLMESASEFTVSGTPPFGTELVSSIEQIQQDIGFNQVLIKDQNELHTQFIGFLESSAADIENTDSLEAITRLLDQSRALEASYQSFSRIRQLSLTNFL